MEEEFVQIGVDAWDGRSGQVDAIFRLGTGTTYPLLLRGSPVASQYGFDRHNYMVLDHEGVVRYRSSGSISRRFDGVAIRQAIDEALDDLDQALAAAEEENGVVVDGGGMDVEGGEEPPAEGGEMEGMEEGMEVEEGDMTAVLEETDVLPGVFELEGNFPNPFNAETVIGFSLSQPSAVRLRVFDMLGQPVAELAAGNWGAGQFRIIWDGRDSTGQELGSGVYFYRLTADGQAQTRKLLLLR